MHEPQILFFLFTAVTFFVDARAYVFLKYLNVVCEFFPLIENFVVNQNEPPVTET